MLPTAEVDAYHLGLAPLEPEQILDRLQLYDYILIQSVGHYSEKLYPAEVLSAFNNALELPVVVFAGFQPDCIYLSKGGQMLKGVMGDYHSAIAVYSYCQGLDLPRAEKLYNKLVFAALGYFASYDISLDVMGAEWAKLGFDALSHVERWQSQVGAFMHTINHPKICVLREIARQSTDRFGLAIDTNLWDGEVTDDLANSVQWPVYRQLAHSLEVPEQHLFVRPVYDCDVKPRELNLGDFLGASFRHYENTGMEHVRSLCDPAALERFKGLLR